MFLVLVFILCVFPIPFPLPGVDRQESIEELRWKVQGREAELYSAQTALAYARARLAMAEGEYATAVENWRKVLTPYEERLKVAERLAPGIADGGIGLMEAQYLVANIRAYLAEAERKPDVMVTELQKAIALQKKSA